MLGATSFIGNPSLSVQDFPLILFVSGSLVVALVVGPWLLGFSILGFLGQ